MKGKGFKTAAIRENVRDRLNLNLFYTEAFLNYAGNPIDSKELYTEIIADELIRNYDQVSKIGKDIIIRRTKTFNAHPNHIPNVKSRLQKFKQLEYCEKLLAIALYNSNETYCLGKILDYEVPLKEEKSDKYGRIDLVSKDANKQSIKLIELKIKAKNGKDETLLRALLEIYIYYKLIKNSFDKFLEDYHLSSEEYKRFQPAILTDKQSLSGKTLLNIKEHPCVQALISKMNNEISSQIEGFVYDYPNRNKPFQYNGEIKQKIILQGDIKIEQIDIAGN
ncbi:MAG: hypothetical protein Q8O28_09760 [Smithellaceae bacterium]|nr:hypothetical protein [Smithellaceae bacterium]